jgi:squalene-hopene/tetraprenyl-beta-curcumene cyclase
MRPDLEMADARLAASRGAAQRAASRLLGMQAREGYWQAELTSDSTLESDWVLLLLWLYPPQDGVWHPPQRGSNALRRRFWRANSATEASRSTREGRPR